MPFYNFGYGASRLQPIAVSDVSFAFRVWINNGTSVERVISISRNSDLTYDVYLDEINVVSKHNKSEKFYRKVKFSAKSGAEKFISKIDSLNLFSYKSVPDSAFTFTATHQPSSLYVVEIKEGEKYNCFKFRTHYPITQRENSKYGDIENLIFQEFDYKFYFK